MYLSRLRLNPDSRSVRRDLGNRQDMHRTVLSGFPESSDSLRAAHEVLFRLDLDTRRSRGSMLVQSAIEPSWDLLRDDYLLSPFDSEVDLKSLDQVLERIAVGQRYAFRLVANPTIKRGTSLKSEHADARRNGRRVPVPDDALDGWLVRKAEASGMVLRGARWLRLPNVLGFRSNKRLSFAAVQFDGSFEVIEPFMLRSAITGGIGSAKAYGFGLLSLAPAGSRR